MEKENVKLLKWFVDFANLDMVELEYGDKVKLTAELHLLLANGLWISHSHSSVFEQASELSASYGDQAFQRVNQLQKSFSEDFSGILGAVDRIRESQDPDKWIPVKKVSTLSSISVSPPAVTFIPRVSLHFPKESKEGKKEFLCRGKPGWRENITFLVASESDSSSGAILLALFLRALNGVPVSVFGRCKECERWFLHTTKRGKEYCSNLCAARSSNRERRAREKAKDSESYTRELKQGTKRARKSYERKVKRALPGAKPARRPRKYVTERDPGEDTL